MKVLGHLIVFLSFLVRNFLFVKVQFGSKLAFYCRACPLAKERFPSTSISMGKESPKVDRVTGFRTNLADSSRICIKSGPFSDLRPSRRQPRPFQLERKTVENLLRVIPLFPNSSRLLEGPYAQIQSRRSQRH